MSARSPSRDRWDGAYSRERFPRLEATVSCHSPLYPVPLHLRPTVLSEHDIVGGDRDQTVFTLHLPVSAIDRGSDALVWSSDHQHPVSPLEAVTGVHEASYRYSGSNDRIHWRKMLINLLTHQVSCPTTEWYHRYNL